MASRSKRRKHSTGRHRRSPTHAAESARAQQERVEILIEGLAAGGDGVAHLPDGRVVFVPLTAPGDRALVRLTEIRKRFARGEVERICEPSSDRVEPRCEKLSHFHRVVVFEKIA